MVKPKHRAPKGVQEFLSGLSAPARSRFGHGNPRGVKSKTGNYSSMLQNAPAVRRAKIVEFVGREGRTGMSVKSFHEMHGIPKQVIMADLQHLIEKGNITPKLRAALKDELKKLG